MRIVAIGLAVSLATVLLPEVPTTDAAQKGKTQANSNLAAGDIDLLESARGTSKGRLKAKGQESSKNGPASWNKTQELRAGKWAPTDYEFKTPKNKASSRTKVEKRPDTFGRVKTRTPW